MLQESDRHTQNEVASLLPIGKMHKQGLLPVYPVELFIRATMPRDKRNQNSEVFFGQTQVVFGCLQLWVFSPKLGLSTAVKSDPVFRVCVNDPPSIHIPDN
jgi:hypothetical protein